jgi:hypothetical protein
MKSNTSSQKIEKSGHIKNVKSGRDTIIIQEISNKNKTKELNVKPDDNTLLLKLGAFFEGLIMKNPKLGWSIMIILPFLSILYSIDYFWWGLLKNDYIFALAVIIIILFISTLSLFNSRTCKKCGKKFAYEIVNKKLLNSGNHEGAKIYNFLEKFKCRFCGDEFEKEVVE